MKKHVKPFVEKVMQKRPSQFSNLKSVLFFQAKSGPKELLFFIFEQTKLIPFSNASLYVFTSFEKAANRPCLNMFFNIFKALKKNTSLYV